MKKYPLILVALLSGFAGYAQPMPMPMPPRPGMPMGVPPPAVAPAPARQPVNYLIRVEWKSPKDETKSLEVLTTEGNVEYDGIQKNSVKINDSDIPVTLKLSGSLTVLNDEKGRLQLFLGRTVPYVTGTMRSGPNASGYSSYSQMSVGLQSTFIVTFGKPVVIQNDENGEISVLVKRLAD